MAALNPLKFYRDLATAFHGDQEYGPYPYSYHLEMNERVGTKYVTDEMLVWAGASRKELIIGHWFHDVLEDTPVTREVLSLLVGDTVESAVWAVTDVEGTNRKERKWGTSDNPGPMRKIPDSRLGLIIKLIDRISNVQEGLGVRDQMKRPNSKLNRYKREHLEFQSALYVPNTPVQSLWNILDFMVESI